MRPDDFPKLCYRNGTWARIVVTGRDETYMPGKIVSMGDVDHLLRLHSESGECLREFRDKDTAEGAGLLSRWGLVIGTPGKTYAPD